MFLIGQDNLNETETASCFFWCGFAVDFRAGGRTQIFQCAGSGDTTASLGAGTAASYGIGQGSQSTAVDSAMGIDAVGAYRQFAPDQPRFDMGDDDAVFV